MELFFGRLVPSVTLAVVAVVVGGGLPFFTG